MSPGKVSRATCRPGNPSSVANICLTKTVWAPRCRPGKSPGKDKSTHDFYISKTKGLLRKQGLTIESKGDEVIFFEGRKLPLVDLAALWHALQKEKADRVVHVADVGQRDKIEICITAAKSAGLIVTNNADDPLSHVGFGLVQGKDFEGFRTSSNVVDLVNLLDEAKSRCKAVLVEQDLKNNRLTNYTFSFNDMLNEKKPYLLKEDGGERELGLHLLRFTE
ncbi:anticodon-binding aminoacyl-tRNA synthetase, class 1a, partial [Tanacetum coccineum]